MKAILLLLGAILLQVVCGDDRFLLKSDSLPEDTRFIPAVGNGHVASQVYQDTIYMNNVFNGFEADSHRARIPSPVAIRPNLTGNVTEHYTLDMFRGSFVGSFMNTEVEVVQEIYAPRSRNHLLVTEIKVTRRPEMTGDIQVLLDNLMEPESPDINFEHENQTDQMYSFGETYEAEFNESGTIPVHMYWTKIPELITLEANDSSKTWWFVASISIDQNEASQSYQHAQDNKENLLTENAEAWKELWDDGQIVVEGNVTLAQTINACFFHIMISTPDENDMTNPFAGLSPGGLARGGKIAGQNISGAYNDYAGHVFWDMDTWIMPPIMQLFPEKAPIMISARTRVLESAQEYAQSDGYEGARFPWEQSYTGFDTCPWEPATLYQLHVTGDVAYSVRQFLYATHDTEFAKEDIIKELIMDIARFWKSRVACDDEVKGCEIYGVMGPDEYHFNVNNSVFTNYNTKLALTTPQLLKDYGVDFSADEKEEIMEFNAVAEEMFILFDAENQFHPQFEGFDHKNATIKQSDVVLLGYPLMMEMSRDVRKNDLEIYEELTDMYGPDTGTWSMHAVGWLELGDQDKANQMFFTMFRNINGPFKIFSEKPPGSADGQRAVNFITGMGGMLQAVLFGYAGIRQKVKTMELDPHVLPGASSWKILGLDYRGYVLNLDIKENGVNVILMKDADDDDSLILWDDVEDKRYELSQDDTVSINRGKALLYMKSDEHEIKPPPSGSSHLGPMTFMILVLLALSPMFH